MDEEEEEDADFYPGWCTAGLSPSAPGQTLPEVHRCISEDGFTSCCWGQISSHKAAYLSSMSPHLLSYLLKKSSRRTSERGGGGGAGLGVPVRGR